MSRTWNRNPLVLWRRAGADVVALCPGQQEPIVLEGSGALVWELLGEPVDEAELMEALADLYEVEATKVREELHPFLLELEAAGAVTSA